MRALIWLLLLAACGSDKGGDKAGETGDTSAPSGDDTDTGQIDYGVTMPWESSGFWDDPGILEPLFGALADTSDTDMKYLVYMATSSDGVNWTLEDEPLMEGINSLDLFQTSDGIILQGLLQPERGVVMTPGTIYGFETKDLVTWGSHSWAIQGLDDKNNLIDPSLALTWDGKLVMNYYRSTFEDGDPVWYEGEHEIWRAVWDGEQFTNDIKVYGDDYLADPVMCNLDGTDWLFVTQNGERVLANKSNGDGTFTNMPDLSWEGQTVPFCRNEGGDLLMVAQGLGGTLVEPSKGTFTETDGFADGGQMYAEEFWMERYCTSPVVGRVGSTWVSFCALNWTAYLTAPDRPEGGPE